MLQTEPSFCIYADEDGCVENEKGGSEPKSSQHLDSGGFSFAETSIGLIVEDDDESSGFKMYLATGFGIGGTGFNATSTCNDSGDVEEMVSQDPFNPLLLKKYAQLLQSKDDLAGAEDYYLHATVEDPKDGESLMQYAKLVWEVHGDHDRALSYFEKAALAAPGDCNILAAYASFLWATDEDREHGGPNQKSIMT